MKPLYGIPESGLHWYITYSQHHKNDLGMTPTRYDPCLLYLRSENGLQGLTTLQVDDSFGFGANEFLEKEETSMKKFISKPRYDMKEGDFKDFNGMNISIGKGNTFKITQSQKLSSLENVQDRDGFVRNRAKAQYIGCCTRPDLCASVQLLAASAKSPTKKDFKSLNHVVLRCHDTADKGLTFVPLDLSSIRLVLFTDASFANNSNL